MGADADGERAQFFGPDEGLVPGQWSSLRLDLNQIFVAGDARNLGQIVILVNERSAPYRNTYFYLANVRFTRTP